MLFLKQRAAFTGLLAALAIAGWGSDIHVKSPDSRTEVVLNIGKNLTYRLIHDGRDLIISSPISMTIGPERVLGENPRLRKISRRQVRGRISPVVPEKFSLIADEYNEAQVSFGGGYGLDIRAYDDGVAYRWRTRFPGRIKISAEEASFRFSADHAIWFPEEESFQSHSERLYPRILLSQVTEKRFCCLPALIEVAGGPKLAIAESDLFDYPGMYLTGEASAPTRLRGKFPAVAQKEEMKNDRDVVVTGRAAYLAETAGRRVFPWRLVIVADRDADLLTNQLVYKLARPLEIQDTSWIRPGKVAWDWWNANNLSGVPFRAGINTETYRYYIDFAARSGIEYVILDEGWYKLGNLLEVNPDLDMEKLLAYGREKKVGIILWVVWKTLEDQLQPALDRFAAWGVKGIKVDFMQRDDQWMVNYYWRIAREAAKRRLLVDFHGAFKPTGLRRAYPNVLTREGVRGLEHSKWSADITPGHDVTIPFTRMLSGPMDFTPGAMVNAAKETFRPVFTRPMSQGTRCHQLAMYVVYESPLQMLADSPTHYEREPECLAFLARVPTVWDETRVLQAEVGRSLALARRRGAEWHIGAMTDWNSRQLTLDLSFLGPGRYRLELFSDGPNADRYGDDYLRSVRVVSSTDRINVALGAGGGCAGRLVRESQ